MTRTPIVESWSASTGKVYAAYIATVGYERRSRHIAETLDFVADVRVAAGFTERHVLNYQDNFSWYKNASYTVSDVSDEDFRSWMGEVLENIPSNDFVAKGLCIDISSLTRSRLAVLVDLIRSLEGPVPLRVDFLYSLAKFSPPQHELVPNEIVGPVLPSFAGWSDEPEKPPIAVLGLGYEEDKALGAVEHIQAPIVWAFIPRSPIARYESALIKANEILLDSIPEYRRVYYDLHNPMEAFVQLESLANRLNDFGSPVFLPFGPKLFALHSLLVACLYPNIAVWRVSAGQAEPAHDRLPSEYILGSSVQFVTSQPG